MGFNWAFKGLNKIHFWLKKWRMKANETKSFQLTFTLKKTDLSTGPPKQQTTDPN
jgi:hypothetical protein